MRDIRADHGIFVDPHTAVGCAAARDFADARPRTDAGSQVVVLSTAHPAKFADIVREATGEEPELPERLARCLTLPKRARKIGTDLSELSGFLLDSFG
jgi:threonine synthase